MEIYNFKGNEKKLFHFPSHAFPSSSSLDWWKIEIVPYTASFLFCTNDVAYGVQKGSK